MKFAEFEATDRRLAILRGLESATDNRANIFLMQRYLSAVVHEVTREQLTLDLQWLEKQGLVTNAVHGEVMVSTLTSRGFAVAHGREVILGVATPRSF